MSTGSAQQAGDPPRLATVWCPDWPTVAAGCAPDAPAAVLRANRVVARTPAAGDAGVVVGQRRRVAQQRCPDVRLIDDDPDRDARVFEPTLRVIADLSPRLDVVEPGWIALATRGPSRYLGGDERLVEHLRDLVRRSGPAEVGSIGVGIADGRFASGVAARLASRRDAPVIVDPGRSSSFCDPLPIGWLHALGEVDVELVELFGRLGMRRLGDLAELDRADVLGRFGPVGVHAHRLATGEDGRPPSTVDPDPERRLERALDEPLISSEPVVFIAKQLADELTTMLAAEGRVCARLQVRLESEHGERSERSWYRSGGLSAAAIVERVRWQLDAWIDEPRGSEHRLTSGIVLIRLVPDEVCADDGDQIRLWGGQSDADRRAARAIARLSTLTTEESVTVPVWSGGRLPADRYRWVPALTVDLDHHARALSATGSSACVSARAPAHGRACASESERGPWPGELPTPSPTVVYSEPSPIEVIDEAGQLVRVDGRGMLSGAPAHWFELDGDEATGWRRGRRRQVDDWAGPWPIEERWWEPEAHRRQARLQIVSEGGDAVLAVVEHHRWWLAARYR